VHEKEIIYKIKKLPEELKKQVLDHINFLINANQKKKTSKKKFKFDWEGGLSEIRHKFPSVELEHKVSKWRYKLYGPLKTY